MPPSSDAFQNNNQDLIASQSGDKATRPPWWQPLSLWLASPWVLGGLVGSVALAVDLYRLGVPSLWFDEAFSVELARQPFPVLWEKIFGPEPNMELYYLLLHGWLGMTGWLGLPATEWLVRFPSALFAALSTVLVWLLGRRFFGSIAPTGCATRLI
jgi:mannosyltransferase